jgi:hypothetical protein
MSFKKEKLYTRYVVRGTGKTDSAKKLSASLYCKAFLFLVGFGEANLFYPLSGTVLMDEMLPRR